MEGYIYSLEMKVRDYECDMQGVVNNANYQHYLEHTRHEFLESLGHSFSDWTEKGLTPMVGRIEIFYKSPLRGGDMFFSRLNIKREGARFVFLQDIYRASDNKLCVKATVDVISVINGKLTRGDEFASIFEAYL